MIRNGMPWRLNIPAMKNSQPVNGFLPRPPKEGGGRPFRSLLHGGVVGIAALGLFTLPFAKSSAATGPLGSASPVDLGLGVTPDFPRNIAEGFKALLAGGTFADLGQGTFARPSLGALSARNTVGSSLDQRLKIPGSLDTLQIPEAFSVVMWVRLGPAQKSTILFGLGEPGGDYLVAATDPSGAPSLAFLSQQKISQVNRAGVSPANLADGHLHAVVAVVNLGSGLVRLYIDGRPEAASTISLWRPRQFGLAFASYSLQGRTSIPGIDSIGLLMPRIVSRELTEDEIKQIKPTNQNPDEDMAAINADLGLRLARDTLMEFWPSQYTYLLRRRPL